MSTFDDDARGRHDAYRSGHQRHAVACCNAHASADDVPDLLAEIQRLRHAQHWVVARDGGRHCERCEQEVTRGEAYEELPGTGGLIAHVLCPDGGGAS